MEKKFKYSKHKTNIIYIYILFQRTLKNIDYICLCFFFSVSILKTVRVIHTARFILYYY